MLTRSHPLSRRSFIHHVCLLVLCVTLLPLAGCQQTPAPEIKPASKPQARHAVASAHPLATEAGLDILRQGGNAFDAAIAVAAVLGVVEPYSAGMGGGGFWLLQREADNYSVFVDARETAPGKAHADLYLDRQGQVDRDKAINGPLAAGIPGQPAAFVHIAQHYGRLPLHKTLARAIEIAREGFPVDPVYRELMLYRADVIARYPESQRVLANNGQPWRSDTLIRQPELAYTLQQLAERGFDGFYRGPVAQRLVNEVRRAGGIWSLDDLANYRVIERAPTRIQYRNARILTAPPPSSGGVALGQMLGMLEYVNLDELNTVDHHHMLIEVMRRAYFERAEHLGDPDHYPVPVNRLLDPERIRHWANSIDLAKATPSHTLGKRQPPSSGPHTTHLSILDADGNAVSATLSINLPFGSGFLVPGTGVLLNNEMDDFSAKPGVPNAYGLVGSQANAIAPGKRPLSSMTPTLVEFHNEQGNHLAILGTPGGSRIITMVLLGLLESLDGKPPKAWVSRPRFHHQYLPDVIQFEPDALDSALQDGLTAKGHNLKAMTRHYGNMQAILWNRTQGTVSAAADPRRIGSAKVE